MLSFGYVLMYEFIFTTIKLSFDDKAIQLSTIVKVRYYLARM